MKGTIAETAEGILKQVFALEETGATALGPAILTAVALASQGAKGSQVIICTDGLANVGLGALDEMNDPTEEKMADDFYQKIG